MVYQFNRGMVVPFTKRFWKVIVLAFAGLFIFTQILMLYRANAGVNAATNIIYNNIPDPLPGNVASLGYEATSTSEFGGAVEFAGSDRDNPKVSVLMSSWACESGHWNTHDCVTTPGAKFNHPITLNIYNLEADNSVGSLVMTATDTFEIPYRPSADVQNCSGSNEGKWYDGNACNSGYGYVISFNLTGTLPDKAIISVAYDTTHHGKNPIGESAACYSTPAGCPYDSLNVGAHTDISSGTALPTEQDAYLDSSWGGAYCDANAGTGSFRLDAGCWGDYLPTFKVEAESANYVKDGKIWICHANNAVKNRYTANHVSLNAVNGGGNNDHSKHTGPFADSEQTAQDLKDNKEAWGDIIPPFEGYAGLNWPEGQAYWEENCNGDGQVLGNQCTEGPGFAASVEESNQGKRKDGSAVLAARSNPDSALNAPDSTFYSLGFGGSIELTFNGYVTDTAGNDITFTEITNGSYPEETAHVEVSQDGINWESAGDVNNKGVNGVDISNTSYDWISYVRVTDTSNKTLFANDADGYDLDAVSVANITCEEPQPQPREPSTTIVANKIVCDDESDLPNWGGGGSDITSASFAADWVGQHPGCTLADNWSFEYKSHGDQSNPGGNTVGPKGGDWQTFTASGQTASVNVPLDNVSLIQTREVLPEGYIPFTDNSDNVSAEFYCHTDVANYDNWEWIQNPQDGATYYCVAWNVKKPVNVLASKIVCDDESRLPNWGNGQTGPAAIDANTADDWLAQGDNGQHCHKVDWNFQWKMDPTSNPGDNTGAAGDGWQTFNSGSGVSISSAQQGNSHTIWVREVWNDDYIPFTGQNTTQDVSAELYCGNDILNYDNWDFISNVQPGETYHCVAWNVQKPKDFKVKADKVICDSEQYLPNWGEGGQNIKKKTAKNYVKQSDGHCWLDPEWNFQWSPDNVGNPGDNLGEQTSPWTTFNGTVTLPVSAVGDGNKVWFREVANDNYIPFSGTPANDPYSAEFYCHNDVLNYDNWDWIANPKAGKKYYCVGFNVLKPATLSATKIVCNTESVLPGWGTGQGNVGVIDANTAANWLAEGDHDEFCHLENWDFEWVADKSSSSNPGDETPLAGAPWKVFNTNDPQGASVDIAPLGDNHKIWVRESFNPSYIGFTGQTTQEGENGSAEIYCNDDILNFDNWEYIDNVQPGAHYYCVAWNVPINGQISGLVYNDKDNNAQQDDGEPGIQGATVWLLTHNSPWTLKAVETTDTGGNYLFDKLSVPGTYYVCQDVESGWFQTQLHYAGLDGIGSNIGIKVPGDVIGDSPELDALISNFCYEVELTADNPVAEQKDFGNYNTQDQTGVLGESTEKDPPSSSNGQVLGASTDAELADTGETTIPSLFIGLIGVGLTFAVAYASKTRNKKFKLNR